MRLGRRAPDPVARADQHQRGRLLGVAGRVGAQGLDHERLGHPRRCTDDVDEAEVVRVDDGRRQPGGGGHRRAHLRRARRAGHDEAVVGRQAAGDVVDESGLGPGQAVEPAVPARQLAGQAPEQRRRDPRRAQLVHQHRHPPGGAERTLPRQELAQAGGRPARPQLAGVVEPALHDGQGALTDRHHVTAAGVRSGVAADHVDGVVAGAEEVGADRLHPGAGRGRGAPGRTVGGVGVRQRHHDVVAQRPPARRPVDDQGDLHTGRVQGVERRRRPHHVDSHLHGHVLGHLRGPVERRPLTRPVGADDLRRPVPVGPGRPARPDAAHGGVDGQGGDRVRRTAAGPAPRPRGRRRVADRAAAIRGAPADAATEAQLVR